MWSQMIFYKGQADLKHVVLAKNVNIFWNTQKAFTHAGISA